MWQSPRSERTSLIAAVVIVRGKELFQTGFLEVGQPAFL
jgi:hypothetical protein